MKKCGECGAAPQNIFWKFSWCTTKKLNSRFHFNLTTSAHNFGLAEKYHFLRDDPVGFLAPFHQVVYVLTCNAATRDTLHATGLPSYFPTARYNRLSLHWISSFELKRHQLITYIMSEEEPKPAAAAGSEPITIRVRDQVSYILQIWFL